MGAGSCLGCSGILHFLCRKVVMHPAGARRKPETLCPNHLQAESVAKRPEEDIRELWDGPMDVSLYLSMSSRLARWMISRRSR